jgi:hypothetical protein
VNLPLFLRLGAGIAKVKIKVETDKSHGAGSVLGKKSGPIVHEFCGLCKRDDFEMILLDLISRWSESSHNATETGTMAKQLNTGGGSGKSLAIDNFFQNPNKRHQIGIPDFLSRTAHDNLIIRVRNVDFCYADY